MTDISVFSSCSWPHNAIWRQCHVDSSGRQLWNKLRFQTNRANVTLVVFVRTNVLLYLCIPEFTVCRGMLLKNRLRHSVIRTMCATTFFFFKRTNFSFLGGNWKDKRRYYTSDVAPDCRLPGYWKVTNVILGLDSRVLCVRIIRRTCSYSYVTLVVLE